MSEVRQVDTYEQNFDVLGRIIGFRIFAGLALIALAVAL